MKKRPLWPLVPPLVILSTMYLYIWLTRALQNSFTECGVLKFTGFYCPGCGGTRSAKSIAAGEWATATQYNALLMSGFLFIMAVSAYLIVRITLLGRPAPTIPNIHPRWIWLGVAAIIVFSVLRNIPAYPFTLLAP